MCVHVQRRLVSWFLSNTLAFRLVTYSSHNQGQLAESAKTVLDIWCVLIIIAFCENRDQPPLVHVHVYDNYSKYLQSPPHLNIFIAIHGV